MNTTATKRTKISSEGMIRVYHGTLDVEAREIVKKGLVPHGSHQFDAWKYPIQEGPEPTKTGVYFTQSEYQAKFYADFRRWYSELTPGETATYLVPKEFQSDGREDGSFTVTKPPTSKFHYDKAKAVVIEMNIPQGIFTAAIPDDADVENPSFIYDGKIPARFIKNIAPVTVHGKTANEEDDRRIRSMLDTDYVLSGLFR